jgi:uncharacterized protein YjbJ (UPF0337 family)
MALGLLRKQCWNAQCQGNPYQEKEIAVSGKAEEIKGRVKEAVGVVTNDEKLKQEGKVDQASGKIKQATEKVVNQVRDAVKGDD